MTTDEQQTVYALGGVSGVGKTHLRTSHPVLNNLPFVDIADMYDVHHASDYIEAREMLCHHLEECLQQNPNSDIVVEAAFTSAAQKNAVQSAAQRHGAVVEWMWIACGREEARRRVRAETNDNPQRRRARLRFIDSAKESFFRPRPGQNVEDVLPTNIEDIDVPEELSGDDESNVEPSGDESNAEDSVDVPVNSEGEDEQETLTPVRSRSAKQADEQDSGGDEARLKKRRLNF